jgi:hypothetical protein
MKKKLYRLCCGDCKTPQSFWPVCFVDIDGLPSAIKKDWVPSQLLEFLRDTPVEILNNNEVVPVVSYETIKALSLKIMELSDDLYYTKMREDMWHQRISKLINDMPKDLARELCPDLTVV